MCSRCCGEVTSIEQFVVAPHSTYDHLNRIMRGRFPRYLRIRRDRGDAYYMIAAEIHHTYRIRVSPETVRVWCTRAAP